MNDKRRMPHIQIYTGGQKIPGLPFHGEMMTCFICGKQQLSDPRVESNWTCFTNPGTGKRAYLCPPCWCEESLEIIMRYLVS